MTSKKVRDAIIRARVERIMKAGQRLIGKRQVVHGAGPDGPRVEVRDAKVLDSSRARLIRSLERQECVMTTSQLLSASGSMMETEQIARDAFEALAVRHALGFESQDN